MEYKYCKYCKRQAVTSTNKWHFCVNCLWVEDIKIAMPSKTKYRIIRESAPGYLDYFYVEMYKTREAPNTDYWERLEYTKASNKEDCKDKLIKRLTTQVVVENFEL